MRDVYFLLFALLVAFRRSRFVRISLCRLKIHQTVRRFSCCWIKNFPKFKIEIPLVSDANDDDDDVCKHTHTQLASLVAIVYDESVPMLKWEKHDEFSSEMNQIDWTISSLSDCKWFVKWAYNLRANLNDAASLPSPFDSDIHQNKIPLFGWSRIVDIPRFRFRQFYFFYDLFFIILLFVFISLELGIVATRNGYIYIGYNATYFSGSSR